jgi:hypothetical protein
MLSRLTAEVVLPADSRWNRIELRLRADGRDLVGEAFDAGPAEDPDRLLGPFSPLRPGFEAREVRLAEAECTEGCCGALYVKVRRDGDEIVWDQWRNPGAHIVPLDVLRFDIQQYEEELERAHQDREWEWPGRTVARLIRELLTADEKAMFKWDSSLDFVESWIDTPEQVSLSFTSPPRDVVMAHLSQHGEPLEHSQFLLPIRVTDSPPEEQAHRIVDQLRSRDPRKHKRIEICGGYRKAG